MKFLKQGVCLALIGAGLAAAPVSLATASTSSTATAAQAAKSPDLVAQIRAGAKGSVTAQTFAATGASSMIRAGLNGDLLPSVAGDSKAAAAAKTDAFMAQYGGAMGAGQGELTRSDSSSDGFGGWTNTYTQSYKGVPVFAGVLKAHVDAGGALTAVSGYASPGIDLSTSPRVSQIASAANAIALVKTSPAEAANGGTAKAKDLRVVSNKLMVYRTGVTKGIAGTNRLAWVSEVRDGHAVREQVIFDAQSGKLLNRWSMLDNDLHRKLYEESYDPDNPNDNLVYDEAVDPTLPTDPDQRDEVVTSGESYWFFKDVFDRDSYDGNGATRITVNNDPTIACPNANWNGITTNYCTGVSSDDVVAHEWGHAYTEYTSGLIYQWQAGGLNESYSDVWGETLDLINNRDDEGEGDTSSKRPDGLCSSHTRTAAELEVTAPASIGHCPGIPAAFGPVIDATGFTDNIVVATDDANPTGPSTTDGCTAFTNAAAVAGNFAYVDRGTCALAAKADNAEAAGATGIVVGTNANPVSQMAGTANIPGIMISNTKGTEIKAAAALGTVTGTMRSTDTSPKADSFRWLVSEKATAFGGAIRDMWNPTCYGDPGKVSDVEYVCGTGDNGGVHSNSGVPNHAYALMVDGGTFNGQTITGIGLTKAAHILWQAQTTYETPVTGFPEHAAALEASCQDLIGKQLSSLQFTPNGHGTFPGSISAGDCDQVHKVTLATELRTPATQCDFQPLLDANTPSSCGAGTGVKPGGYSEDFEDGLTGWDLTSPPPAFPGGVNANWTSSVDLPQDNLPAGDHTAAFGPAPDQAGVCNGGAGDFSSVNYLTSPDITVGASGDVADSQRLSFTHNVETELGFDGGVVYVSVNHGSYDPVPADAYVFNEPSVLATTGEGSTDPLQGLDGFTGTDGGKISSQWGTSIIDLSAVGASLGDTINVRFAVGRDGCGGVFGWWVDNVKVTTCKTLATPTVSAAHQPEPSTFGSASAVGVTVSGGSGTPTGSVTVKEGAATLGTATLDGTGKASVALPASLAAGSHSLSVVYSGDSSYDTKTQAVTATVNKAASTTTASAPKEVKPKKKFNVTASVAAPGGAPTGTVQVFDGSKLIGTGTLANGTVTITITNGLKKDGKHTLTVKYLGSANVAASQTTVKVKVKEKGKKHKH